MDEIVTNTPEGTDGEQEVQLTAIQLEAMNAGWSPKEDYKGDPERWVDAGEFLRRGELFSKIEHQSRELKDVRRALSAMSKLHADVREVEYKRALETLRHQKKSALEEGDAEAVIAADERIDLVREQQRLLAQEAAFVPEEQSGEEHPEFVQWKNQNTWYSTNRPMKAFADALGAELAAGGMPPAAVLKKVEEEVKKEFPNRFQNPRQNRVAGVEGGNGKGTTNSDNFKLTPLERRIMETLVKEGTLTKEQYIADLKTTGRI